MIEKDLYRLVLLFVVSTSCSKIVKENNTTIAIDIESQIHIMEQVNLSCFTDNILYVPLENKNNITVYDKPIFDISDKFIVTYDLESCLLLFDLSGRLSAKFGSKGRGPEEYLDIDNLCLSKEKIYFNSLNDLFEFNTNGKF